MPFFFLQQGQTIFKNGVISKNQRSDWYREGKPHTTEGSSKSSDVCSYVCLLTTLSKAKTT